MQGPQGAPTTTKRTSDAPTRRAPRSCALNAQGLPGALHTAKAPNRGPRRRNSGTPARMGLPPRKPRRSLSHRQPRRHTKPGPHGILGAAHMPHRDHGTGIMPLTNQHPRRIQERLPARLHKNAPVQARHEPARVNLTLPRTPTRGRLQSRRNSDDEHATSIAQKPLCRSDFWMISRVWNFTGAGIIPRAKLATSDGRAADFSPGGASRRRHSEHEARAIAAVLEPLGEGLDQGRGKRLSNMATGAVAMKVLAAQALLVICAVAGKRRGSVRRYLSGDLRDFAADNR